MQVAHKGAISGSVGQLIGKTTPVISSVGTAEVEKSRVYILAPDTENAGVFQRNMPSTNEKSYFKVKLRQIIKRDIILL